MLENMIKTLTQIAVSKAIPFCYSCYTRAPSGKCTLCHSDDLMFELPGIGVEYGTHWLLRELLAEHLFPADTLEAFEQSVADCYSDTVKIGWIEYDTVSALKELDPVSWNIAHNEWIDSEVDDENLLTFDNGSTHYWCSDIEHFVENSTLSDAQLSP